MRGVDVMQMVKLRPYLKWSCYYLLLLFLNAIQTTPHLFEIFSIKPVLIVPLVVCVCMFESVMPSAVFSMIAGLVWDVSSDKILGFNGIILIVCGVFISLLCIYYFHTKVMNSIAFCAIVMIFQGLLNYLFYFAIWQYSGSYVVLISDILPTALYTVITTVPIFFAIKFISYKSNYLSGVK